jgi:hypothetical protein
MKFFAEPKCFHIFYIKNNQKFKNVKDLSYTNNGHAKNSVFLYNNISSRSIQYIKIALVFIVTQHNIREKLIFLQFIAINLIPQKNYLFDSFVFPLLKISLK